MEFHNYEERFFWKRIFIDSVASGKAPWYAAQQADDSVERLRARPVVKPTVLTKPSE